VSGQKQKVTRALDWLEDTAARLAGRIDIGTLTVGCALGYLDFRYADDGWRTGRPRLAAWYETMAGRTSFLHTLPS
jgi:glutathione S-transferase